MSTATLPSGSSLQPTTTYAHNHRRLWRRGLLLLIALALLGVLMMPVARKVKRKLFGPFPAPVPAKIVKSEPASGATGVPIDTTIRGTLRLGKRPIDAATVGAHSVFLVRAGDQLQVPVQAKLTPEGELLVEPQAKLDPLANYNLLVTPMVKDQGGTPITPFIMGFTTAGDPLPGVAFEKVDLPTTSGFMWTCVTFGPDGRLYAGCDDGRIYRFELLPDGTLGSPELLDALQKHAAGPRLLTGFCFDPAATADNLVIYASNGHYAYENAEDLSGRITRLAGPQLADVHDLVTGLPRSVGDHLTNQPSFGPDGCLYIPQASNTAFGDADPIWGMRPEHRLNATILRLDVKALRDPAGKLTTLDVRTPDVGGTFDPASPGSPMTIYADGARLAYDLLWHSNGRLYVPVNGSSSGGNAPAGKGVPQLKAISTAEDDWLFCITPDRYYGHPNPQAGHFVLNGGNPTAGYDFAETSQYPVGTMPDPNWQRPAWVIGQHYSPNGVIEYKSDHFGGALKGRILVVRYSRGKDVLTLKLDSAGNVVRADCQIPGLSGFENPLDLVENPANGDIYVADLMAKKIVLCRPLPPATARLD